MQKKIITTLLVISIALLMVNIILGFIENNEGNTDAVKHSVKTASIDSVFFSSLNGFGLDSNWVEKKHIKNKNYDSLKYVFYVKLPSDLPITTVLQDLSQRFDGSEVNLVSEEKIINRKSVLDIFAGDVHKLQAQFVVDKDAERDHANFAFIISDFDKLSEDDRAQILQSKYAVSVLFVPSKDYLALIPDIVKSSKRYCLEINDEISEDDYELDGVTSKKVLKESIRKIVRDFSDADVMFIDDNSGVYQSAAFNYISEQFGEAEVVLNKKASLVSLPEEYHEAKSLFSFYIKSSINKEGRLLSLTGKTFLSLARDLDDARKIGTKYYFPSEVLKNNLAMHLD